MLGEELRVDRVQDGLVVRDRPVEVERERVRFAHPAPSVDALLSAAMPLDAFALALGSAFLHALWNLILGRERDPVAATAIALVVSVVVFAPVAALRWDADAGVWPYIVVTSGAPARCTSASSRPPTVMRRCPSCIRSHAGWLLCSSSSSA